MVRTRALDALLALLLAFAVGCGSDTTPPAPIATPTPSPSATTAPPPPLAGHVVVIDPGHPGSFDASLHSRQVPAGNGRTKDCNLSGTSTNDGWPEHTYTWLQAEALRAELEARGATVVLTRADDESPGLCVNERAAVANDAAADLMISLHADGSLSSSARGFHIIYSTTMEGGDELEARSQAFAELARDALATTPMPVSTYVGGGTGLSPRDDIAGVNLLTVSPGIMVEMGNMRHADDATLLASEDFRRQAAVALADAAQGMLVVSE
ncbi:MAG: N-acetylmuramoyl-L-alanine amidase [Aeromicrobium sp.]|uniref:N-acetylmuramoyl-L-alanine amidase family protein n=1 Tax=Aeromicrobium sp. TaxID=1871063 RepID=UPI0039E47EF4